MTEEKLYPISEIFTSPQGEGLYTGVLMTFVRFAGCSVGKPFEGERKVGQDHSKLIPLGDKWKNLPIYTECCTLYDGRTFECDTDYRVKERLTVKEICERIPKGVKHVCITGGEPFIHNMLRISAMLMNTDHRVHIETSGTKDLECAFGENCLRSWVQQQVWITVSPKFGVLKEMLDRADEIKLLIDDRYDESKLPNIHKSKTVYLQPVNGEFEIDKHNLQHCIEIQKEHPTWRISVQLHKVMGVR